MNAKEIPKHYRICNICRKKYHPHSLTKHKRTCQKKNAEKAETNEDDDEEEEWIEPTDTPYHMDFALAIFEKGRGYPEVLCMRCCTTLSHGASARRHFIGMHTVRRLNRSKKKKNA